MDVNGGFFMDKKCSFDPLDLFGATWIGNINCPQCGVPIVYGMEHDFYENFKRKFHENPAEALAFL
jgi:hypothetical protein